MDIIIRNYQDSDYQFIYDVKKEVYQKYVESNWGEWNEEKQQNFFVEFMRLYQQDIKIIVCDGVDIGFYHCKDIDKDTFEIVNICIKNEFQGKGIGTKILKDMLNKNIKRNVVLQCFKQNPVVKLYSRLGFEEIERKDFHIVMLKKKENLIFENEEIYIRVPNESDEKSVMELRQELIDFNSEFAGSSKLEDYTDYFKWLEKLRIYEQKETCPEGKVPATLFLTFRKSDNKLLGMVQVRRELNKYLAEFGGHIGDVIRPTERNKGYATMQIALALEFCKSIGINEVFISAKLTNIASQKTIMKNGGILQNVVDCEDYKLNRYYIYL